MKNRVFENYVTTILGAIIILASLGAIYFEKATAEAMYGWFTAGVTFIRSKDSILGLEAK